MTGNARIYIRVSRPDETAILEHQREAALAHVTKEGLTLVRVYEEIASGADEGRNAFNQLMHDAARGEVIVFTSLSRMTRGGIAAALEILRQLELHGVGWHFVEQPILNWDSQTPKLARDIILSVLAAVDEDYRRNISEKTRAALARRKALGHPIGRMKGAKDRRPRKHNKRSHVARLREAKDN